MCRQYNGNALQCLLFAFLIPGGVSVSECGQWTPYHTPLLLTHPSAGSMVLVGTGTTASVELDLVSSAVPVLSVQCRRSRHRRLILLHSKHCNWESHPVDIDMTNINFILYSCAFMMQFAISAIFASIFFTQRVIVNMNCKSMSHP